MAASITHPLDLTKVRLQTSKDKGMIKSIKKTVAANGTLGPLLAVHQYQSSFFSLFPCGRGTKNHKLTLTDAQVSGVCLMA